MLIKKGGGEEEINRHAWQSAWGDEEP